MNSDNILKVLIIDDAAENADRLKAAMEERCEELGVAVQAQTATSADDAFSRIMALRVESTNLAMAGRSAGHQSHEDLSEPKSPARVFVFCDRYLGTDWSLDEHMLTGFEMLQLIREQIPWAKTVMYSAQSNEEDLRKALRCGAYDLVTTQTLEDTSRGLLRVLAGFAAIEYRIEQANAALATESSGAAEHDLLAHLLLKAPTSLLVVGRHGNVWFQNEHHRSLCGCHDGEGKLCYRCFHPWSCNDLGCPWCPTLESARRGKARHGQLLLPASKNAATPPTISCVERTSEPLWPLGEHISGECAGAIECSLDRTVEWNGKRPIERILDLLVSVAGVLVFPDPAPVQVNLYEVSRSGLTCRGVASCVVRPPSDQRPTIEEDVVLFVDPDSPGWHGTPTGPGPAAVCGSIRPLCDRDSPRVFLLEEHPATGKEAADRSGLVSPERPSRSFPWQQVGQLPADAVQWRYRLLDAEGASVAPVLLLEVGGPAGIRCLSHATFASEGSNTCDLELYVPELQRAVKDLRYARIKQRGERIPNLPNFDGCQTRAEVWRRVEDALKALGKGLAIPPDEIWWHYRDYREVPTTRGTRNYFLNLPQDILSISGSPYAKHAARSCPNVELPSPAEWDLERNLLEEDPEALERKGYRHTKHPEKSGPWLCIVSGSRVLKHCPPSRVAETDFAKVLQEAKRVGDDDALAKLKAIRSFADYPIGRRSTPVGTFHVQSTDDDLFIPAVVTYLEQLVQEIERALLLVRAREFPQQRLREEILKHHISSELLEISYLAGKAVSSASDQQSRRALESLQRKTHDVAVQQQVLLGEAAIPSEELADCEFGQLLQEAIARGNDEAAAQGDDGRGQPLPIASPATVGPPFLVPARRWIMARALDSLFRAAILLRSRGGRGRQCEIAVAPDTVGERDLTITVPYEGVAIQEHVEAISTAACEAAVFREMILDASRPPWLRPVLLELACARLLAAHSLGAGAVATWSAEQESSGIRIGWQLRRGEA